MTGSPAFASGPVPLINSLVTSVVGAAPEGTVTVGLLASGPLVGVLAAAVGVEAVVEVGVVSPATCGTELVSDSLPTEIVEPPEEPQPAIRAARPSVARAAPARARKSFEWCEGMKFITAGSVTHRGTRAPHRLLCATSRTASRGPPSWAIALGSARTVLGGDVAAP